LRKLLEGDLRDDLGPLRTVLERDRAAATTRLTQTLRSRRLLELFQDWERLLESLVELPVEDRPDARRSIGSLTGARVVKVYERIIKLGEQIDDDSPAESYHELRKKGKELRYLLDLFAVQAFDADAVVPLIASLKDLQDVLGRHQDRQVQAETIRSLRDEVVRLDDGAAALMAMGLLVDRLDRGQAQARAEFAERFAVFAGRPQQKLVRETFG
jgi:CHAD domain-containing protein